VFDQVGGSKPDACFGHGSVKLSRRLLENGQPTILIAEHSNVEAAEVESSGCLGVSCVAPCPCYIESAEGRQYGISEKTWAALVPPVRVGCA
jgi:hypothetical protein